MRYPNGVAEASADGLGSAPPVTVRSTSFGAFSTTSTVPVDFFTCPAGHVYAIKGIGLANLSGSPTAGGVLYYRPSGGTNTPFQGFQTYGNPYADLYGSIWCVLLPGDTIAGASLDGSECSYTFFGADLVD